MIGLLVLLISHVVDEVITHSIQVNTSRQEIHLTSEESEILKAGTSFMHPEIMREYFISSPENTEILAICDVKLLCEDKAYMIAMDGNSQQILNGCTKEDFVKYRITSDESMRISLYSGTTTRSRYSCQFSAKKLINPVNSENCKCGRSFKGRIVNGEEVSDGDIPWQVSLQNNVDVYNAFCGGSVVSDRYVITAAHCVGPDDLSVSIYVGSTHVFEGGIRYKIAQIFQHKKYDDNETLYDITLLKMLEPFILTSKVYPICLPRTMLGETFSGKELLVSGFGAIHDEGPSSITLLKTTVIGLEQSVCKSIYNASEIKSYMLCARAHETDSCQGDSGGPLAYRNDRDVYYLAGIVSWGMDCADPVFPGIYTRTTYFMHWIDKHSGGSICSR